VASLGAVGWVQRLVKLHPADPLVVAPLLLDLVTLPAESTLFVPAGVPHAYLSGCGVEIMAASDNVLRAGLTSKTVAVEELLHVIDCRARPDGGTVTEALSDHEVRWHRDWEEFQLTRIRLDNDPARPVALHRISGPQIVLCTRGPITLHADGAALELTPGSSAFVSAAAWSVTATGQGELFRAAVGICR